MNTYKMSATTAPTTTLCHTTQRTHSQTVRTLCHTKHTNISLGMQTNWILSKLISYRFSQKEQQQQKHRQSQLGIMWICRITIFYKIKIFCGKDADTNVANFWMCSMGVRQFLWGTSLSIKINMHYQEWNTCIHIIYIHCSMRSICNKWILV